MLSPIRSTVPSLKTKRILRLSAMASGSATARRTTVPSRRAPSFEDARNSSTVKSFRVMRVSSRGLSIPDQRGERSKIRIVAEVVNDGMEALGTEHRDLILIEITIRRSRQRNAAPLAEDAAEIHVAEREHDLAGKRGRAHWQ